MLPKIHLPASSWLPSTPQGNVTSTSGDEPPCPWWPSFRPTPSNPDYSPVATIDAVFTVILRHEGSARTSARAITPWGCGLRFRRFHHPGDPSFLRMTRRPLPDEK